MTDANAHTEGSGQSVNVVVSAGKTERLFILALILVTLISWPLLYEAKKALDEANTNLRLDTYWMEQAKTTVEAHGISLSPLPILQTNERKSK